MWKITSCNTSTLVAVSFLCTVLPSVHGFTTIRARLPPTRLFGAASSAADLFGTESWEPIQKELDTVPIFTCANAEGQPLAYEVNVNGETFKVPFFYCDVDDAKTELAKAQQDIKLEGLDLIPVPLGRAFQMWAKDEAVIVPNQNAVQAAGAPPGTRAVGQQVPLFACMDIMQTTEEGKAVLPLFMVLEEANAAMDQAMKIDGGDPEEFEVMSLSLGRAVELLATVPETPAFQFVPPAASIKYINDYMSL